MNKLKPCPFCGGEPDLDCGNLVYFVTCNNPDCGVQPTTEGCAIGSKAVKKWNTRAEPSIPVAELKALIEASKGSELYDPLIYADDLQALIDKHKGD